MPFGVSWRLIGVDEKVLDRGELDGVHQERSAAVAEILLQLQSFAIHERDDQRDEWWAKRGPDASLEMRFRVETRTATTS